MICHSFNNNYDCTSPLCPESSMMGASMLEVLGTLLSITALSNKSRSTKLRKIIFARPHLLALLTIIISFLCFF